MQSQTSISSVVIWDSSQVSEKTQSGLSFSSNLLLPVLACQLMAPRSDDAAVLHRGRRAERAHSTVRLQENPAGRDHDRDRRGRSPLRKEPEGRRDQARRVSDSDKKRPAPGQGTRPSPAKVPRTRRQKGGQRTPSPGGQSAQQLSSASEDRSSLSPSPPPVDRAKADRRKSTEKGPAPRKLKTPPEPPEVDIEVTGQFDYVPIKVEDCIKNWTLWLQKVSGIQNGVLPVSALIELFSASEVWNPAMASMLSLKDLHERLRMVDDAPVLQHNQFPFLVQRVWTLCSCAPSPGPAVSPQRAPTASQDINGDLAKILKDIHDRNQVKPLRDGVMRDSTVEEDEHSFDLAAAVTSLGVWQIPVMWFAETKRLGSMVKHFQKAITARGSIDHKTVWIGTSEIENWAPPWVGAELSPQAKTALLKSWRSRTSTDPAMALSSICSFWLSHAVVGALPFQTVLAHILVLLQLLQERGVAFMVNYERQLRLRIESHIRADTTKVIDEYLITLQKDLVVQIDVQAVRAAAPQPVRPTAPVDQTRGRGSGGKSSGRGERQVPAPAVPGPVAKESKGSGKSTGKVKKARICFEHDPAKGLACPRGDQCPNDHLDTRSMRTARGSTTLRPQSLGIKQLALSVDMSPLPGPQGHQDLGRLHQFQSLFRQGHS